MDDNSMTVKEEFEKAREYWQSKFPGEVEEIDLPHDFERSLVYKREQCEMVLAEGLQDKLLSLSKNQDLLLYVILLSALNVLIFRYTDNKAVGIGAPIYTGKGDTGSGESLIIFMEMADSGMTFKELLLNVKKTVIGGYENQHYVIENMLDALGVGIPVKLLSRIILILEDFHKKEIIGDILNSPANDITISLSRTAGRLAGSIEYNGRLFKRDTVKSICRHYLYILEQVAPDINMKLFDIDLLPDREKERILYGFNTTERAYPGGTIHELFDRRVAAAPANIALLSGARQFTYGELHAGANRLAGILRRKGVKANTIVGLIVEGALETVISIIAVLKAGGAYLPVEFKYPGPRKEYILRDSNAGILIIQEHILAAGRTLPGRWTPENVVIIDKIKWAENEITSLNRAAADADADPLNPAYVLYTSGTTGRPKGTLVRHRGIVNYTFWRLETYNYTQKDVTLQMLSYGFDGFGSNFYSGLLSGGTLLMIPDLKKLDFNFVRGAIRRCNVTNMSVVPPIYQMILDGAGPGNLGSLRFVVLAGEKCRADIVKESKEKAPGAILVNEYGPTEAAVTAAGHSPIDELNTAVIGKPIANTRIYVLDNCLKPVPLGVPGELFIEGVGLAPGYLNNPQLTVEKFIEAVPAVGGGRIYRTGDLGRWLPDGSLELLGRKDYQVKIRGFRIEPQEVEKRLIEIDIIKGAVVTDFEDPKGEKYLCAYFVSEEKVDIKELKKIISKALPDYMIPSYFMQLDKIPLTANGKVGRKALPEPAVQKGDTHAYAAPRDSIERKLVEIWSEVLLGKDASRQASDGIGIDDDFFDLGGHSLRATTLVARIYKELNVKVSLAEMFKMPTIRGLSGYVNDALKEDYVPVNAVEQKDFYGLSHNQQRLWVINQLEPGSPAYNLGGRLSLRHPVDPEAIKGILYKLMERHDSFRTCFRTVGDQPVQRVLKPAHVEIPFECVDISSLDEKEKQQKRLQVTGRTMRAPFRLTAAPLLRTVLLKLNEEQYDFVFNMHHIISDGWSMEVLKGEFSLLYEGYRDGRTVEFEYPELQYKDFIAWQNQQLSGREFKEKSHDYWRKKIEEGIPLLELPADFACSRSDIAGASYRCMLQKDIKSRLEKLCKDNHTTLFILMFSVYNLLLSYLSSAKTIVCGIIAAGREDIALHHVVGYFINFILLKNHIDDKERFDHFLAAVGGEVLGAFQHQSYPLERVLDDLNMRYPGISAAFNMIDMRQTVVGARV